MTEFRVLRDQTTYEQNVFDVQITDTSNPFGNFAVVKIEDNDGEKFDLYPRGTRIDIEAVTGDVARSVSIREGETESIAEGETDDYLGASIEGTWQVEGTATVSGDQRNRFSGYVVERRELDERGGDSLEVEVYSFDQFLRRGYVSNDQTGNNISEALEDIIKTDTPVAWDAANVSVEDNQTLTRSYQGEKVENALLSLRQSSGNEDFGVNSDVEFFFRPKENESAPRDIDNTEWTNYDIPEKGKETVNEVTVWFDGGDRSVTVDNGADKQELQDNLGTNDPIAFSEQVNRPGITNIDDARTVGQEILSDRDATLTGTVTTFGLIDAEPGQIINIEIKARGISGDFRIAEIEYNWAAGETVLTIVEKKGDNDDVLVRLSDSVKRNEMQNADRDAIKNTITSTQIGIEITTSGDVDSNSFTEAKLTNTARNKLRDGWADKGNIAIDNIAVGNDPSVPKRSDTALGNQLASTSASESLPDAKTARYTATLSETDVREVGLFDSNSDLIARGIIDDVSLTANIDVTIDLTVSDNSSLERGVITDTGQTSVRDIIADNTPALPTDYAYGDDGTLPGTGDTSLGNQLVEVGLDQTLVQSASSDSDWSSVTGGVSDTDPLEITNNKIRTLQTCFTEEGENFDRGTATGNPSSTTSDFSGGDTAYLTNIGEYAEWDFTLDYKIPAGEVGVAARIDDGNGAGRPAHTWYLDGQQIDTQNNTNVTSFMVWADVGDGQLDGNGYDDSLTTGEHTLKVEVDDTDGADVLEVDVIAPYDKRYNYNFDNNNGGSGGYLDGPELYPDVETVELAEASTRRTLQNATATQSWNDTSNNQFIELSNDGGNTYIRTNNSQTATANFASAETGVRTKVGISRYGSRSSATPQTGFNRQEIDTHELEADIDAINPTDTGAVDVQAVVSPNTINGSTVREAGELDTNDNLLARSVFADVDVGQDERLISSETVTWTNP